MRQSLLTLALLLVLIPPVLLAPVGVAQAQTTKVLITNALQQAGESGAGYGAEQKTQPLSIIFALIRAFLALLGIIFFVLMLYGGYLWMTASGDEQQVEKAKQVIGRAVIGLIVILMSLAITRFVIYGLTKPGGTPYNYNTPVINLQVNINSGGSWSPFNP